MRLFCNILAIGLLSGCFSPLTTRMDQTNKKLDDTLVEITKSTELLGELHTDSGLVGGVGLFANNRVETNARIRALTGYFEFAALQDSIFQYLGTPMPIYSEEFGPIYDYSFTSEEDARDDFMFKNVTYVAPQMVFHEIVDKRTSEIKYNTLIRAVNDGFYNLLDQAVVSATDLTSESYKGATTEEKILGNKKRAVRLMHIGSCVYGARRLVKAPATTQVVTSEDFEKSQSEWVKTEAQRRWFLKRMERLLHYVDEAEQIPVLRALAVERMGLSAAR